MLEPKLMLHDLIPNWYNERNFEITSTNGLMKIFEAIRYAQFHFHTS
jgi:hypothetical protein